VVGGNVSLYNESPDGPILPTPVVGMVGKLPDAARAGRIGFAREGDAIALVGRFSPSRAGSEVAKLQGEPPLGPLPFKDVPAILDAQEKVRGLVRAGALQNAHDIAEGGLLVALAECCLAGDVGARVRLPDDLDLFGEDLGTAFLVSGEVAALEGLPVIGTVGGERLVVEGEVDVELRALREAHSGGLEEILQ